MENKFRLVMTSSRWGNLYHFRFFINGKRVSERAFAECREALGSAVIIGASVATRYGYRNEWMATA